MINLFPPPPPPPPPPKKNNIIVVVLFFSIFVIGACKKSDNKISDPVINLPVTLPVLTTTAVSGISQTTAISGGTIAANGGGITARGICWSTTPNPLVTDFKMTDGSGSGTFKSSLVGLTNNTTYHVRAYATNSVGTNYGNDVLFTAGTVTDADGNMYHTVIIGTQVWTLENLKTTKYRNGEAIPNIKDNTAWTNLTTGAYCKYENSDANGSIYGYLYNGYAVSDSRNIAPAGWHVPSDAEWTTLSDYLGGADVAGDKLKEAGNIHWIANPPNSGTNESSFTGLPGGLLYINGNFYGLYTASYWWSSTVSNNTYFWYRSLSTANTKLGRLDYDKKNGMSVRLVKD